MITLHNNNKPIELPVSDDSHSYEAIMGDDTLTLYFSHPGFIDIPVGTYCDFYGKRYSLTKDGNFKKNGERNYEYTLILETSKADASLWKVRNTVDNRIKFSYTAKPKEHLKLLVDNLNRRSSGWTVGECLEGTEKTIEYNHTYILDALNQLANSFETEWQIVDKTIHLRKVEYNKDNPLALSYGKGNGFKTGVGRESGESPTEIVLVQGTDRNINFGKYGAKELLLPKSQTLEYEGRLYKTSADGTYIMRADKELTTAKEDSLDCSEIYPSRIGKVSEVVPVNAASNFFDFIDGRIPDDLNFEDCLIEGEKITVIFQSGMLVGKEFDVKYIHKAKDGKKARRFEIVPQEIDGITMPDGNVWMPKPGDEYAVFGIQLPDAYLCNDATKTGASWDMFREAAKYLYEHEEKSFTFRGTLDGIWAKKRWLQIGGKLVLGGYVNFSDAQFHPEGSLIRMTGIKRYVNNPYSPEIELSNDPVGTSISSDLNKIETNEVVVEDKYRNALQFTKRRFRDAQETMDMLAGSLLNFSGSVNPITVATMQMLVGDESLQFRFVNSKTNPVKVVHNITYSSGTKKLNVPAGIIQHMTLGIKELSSTYKGKYKFWDMAEYNSPSLVDADKKFYLYAKCSKDNQSGTFLLSETAIGIEQVGGYYHLLVGILNTEYDGDRSYVSLYGFTEILPGRITTDKIVSNDGKTYFDLSAGEIGGRIVFKSSTGENKTLPELESAAAEDATRKSNDAKAASEAYAEAQAKAERLKAEAYADGVVSEEEARAIEDATKKADSARDAAIAAAAADATRKSNDALSSANMEAERNIAKFGSTIIEGGYIKTSLIEAGSITAEKIDVSNLFSQNISANNFNLDHGSIGGFAISNGRIGMDASSQGEGGGLSISKDFLRVGGNNGYAMFGDNVIPASTGGAFCAAGRVYNHRHNQGGYGYKNANYGIFIDVSGGDSNYGVQSNAPLIAPAFIATKVYRININSGNYNIDFSQYSVFMIHSYGNYALNLPKESSVASMFGYSSLPSDFGFEFTLLLDTNSNDMVINGVYNQDGWQGSLGMAKGDSMRLLCIKNSDSGFRYQVINYGI